VPEADPVLTAPTPAAAPASFSPACTVPLELLTGEAAQTHQKRVLSAVQQQLKKLESMHTIQEFTQTVRCESSTSAQSSFVGSSSSTHSAFAAPQLILVALYADRSVWPGGGRRRRLFCVLTGNLWCCFHKKACS
jgi:hypothetical protein